MKSLLFPLICLLTIFGCKQKSSSDKEGDAKDSSSTEKPAIQNILEDTYNYKSFKEKDFVVLDLLWTLENTIAIEIYFQPGNGVSVVKKEDAFLYLTDERTYEKPSGAFKREEINFYRKTLNAYRSPFRLSDHRIIKASKELALNNGTILDRSFKLIGDNEQTLYLFPKTDLIKAIEIGDDPQKRYLVFEKHITVQRIPISMSWNIYNDSISTEQPESKIEVKRISYPDELAFNLEVPEKARPILNN